MNVRFMLMVVLAALLTATGVLAETIAGLPLHVQRFETGAIRVWLGDVLVAEHGGRAASYTEAAGAAVMKEAEITVRVALDRGDAAATVWTCDFSYDYVKINAEYRT